MATNFGTRIAITGFVRTIATKQLFMEGGLSGQPTECRYCRYLAHGDVAVATIFLAFCIWGAPWRHLANAAEPSVCGGDAALCQIKFDRLLDMLIDGGWVSVSSGTGSPG